MRRQETVTEQLRYKFTADEHLENTRMLVGKLGDATDYEATAKAVKANLKEREVALAAEVSRLARLVRDGFDVRGVECRWDYGRPGETQKTLVRLDSNEDVRTEMMLPHERQEMLKFEAPAHVLSGPGSLKDKKITEVADADIDLYASRDLEDLLKYNWIQVDIDAVFAEAKRRAEVKEVAATNVTQMPAPGGPVLAVDNTVNEEGHGATKALASETAGCALCDAGAPLLDDGLNHQQGDFGTMACPVAARNASFLSGNATPPDTAPLEEAHTLPSARAVDGPKRSRRSSAPVPLPTAEEREAMEQMQAENAPIADERDDAPEI